MQAQSTNIGNRRNLRMREREVARIPIDAIRPNPYQPAVYLHRMRLKSFVRPLNSTACFSQSAFGSWGAIALSSLRGNDGCALVAWRE